MDLLIRARMASRQGAEVVKLGVSERCELFGCSAAALTGLAVDEDRATLIGQGLCSRLGADLVDRQQHGVCQMAGDVFLFVADIHDRAVGMRADHGKRLLGVCGNRDHGWAPFRPARSCSYRADSTYRAAPAGRRGCRARSRGPAPEREWRSRCGRSTGDAR